MTPTDSSNMIWCIALLLLFLNLYLFLSSAASYTFLGYLCLPNFFRRFETAGFLTVLFFFFQLLRSYQIAKVYQI